MHLITRPPKITDLERCAEIAQDSFAFGTKLRAELIVMWRQLIQEGIALAGVVEDQDGAEGEHIIGFGFSVFVTDEFAHEARTNLPPYIAKQVLLRWQDSRSPILTRREIERENSGKGLNYLGLHMSWGDACVSPAQQPLVRDVLLKSLFDVLSGYKLKLFMKEVYGTEDLKRFLTFGTKVTNDYADFFTHNPSSRPGSSLHPYLVSVMRQEALSAEGTYSRRLFNYTDPRFFFSRAEQDLLQLALYNLDDAQIAAALIKAQGTIQKQWRKIYERISEIDASFFPNSLLESSGSEGRGKGKKNFLLNYLRSHPEELRPHSRPKNPGT